MCNKLLKAFPNIFDSKGRVNANLIRSNKFKINFLNWVKENYFLEKYPLNHQIQIICAGILNIPKCESCNNITLWNGSNFRTFCSHKCAHKLKNLLKNFDHTLSEKEKYGSKWMASSLGSRSF